MAGALLTLPIVTRISWVELCSSLLPLAAVKPEVVGHGDRVDRRDGLAYSQVLDVILINFKIPSDRAVGCAGVDAIATDGEGVAEIAQDGIEII